jgi:hypothetical protein
MTTKKNFSTIFCSLLFEAKFTPFFKEKSHKEVHKEGSGYGADLVLAGPRTN